MKRILGWIVDGVLKGVTYVWETVFGRLMMLACTVALLSGCQSLGHAIGEGIAKRTAEEVVQRLPQPQTPMSPVTPIEGLLGVAASTAAIVGHRYWFHAKKKK